MNPVYSIVAARAVRAASLAAAFQVVYRSVVRTAPPLSVTVAVNGLIAVALCLDLSTSFYGPSQFRYPGLCTRMPTSCKSVALTFDDGPSPDSTPIILELLKQLNAAATFFLLGENAQRHPELVERIFADGHAIALHGFRHKALAARSTGFCAREIRETRLMLGPEALPYFRPPYGFKSRALMRACVTENVVLTTWSINPKDYLDMSPDLLAQRVLKKLHPGAIVLLHEWARPTQEALPITVNAIRASGYDIVHLPKPEQGTANAAAVL